MAQPDTDRSRTKQSITINKSNMFKFRDNSGFHGSGYIVLNVLRALNIVILTLVAAASALMMVFAKFPNAYQLFADVTLFFIICVCGLLILSEIPGTFLKSWIARTWPVFGEGHGFTWLGTSMIMMGCHTLGALSHEPFTAKKVGKPVWQVIMAAGILAITFGFFNITCSFLFKDGAGKRSAREVRQDGATPSLYKGTDDYSSTRSPSVRDEKHEKRRTRFSRMLPKFGTKPAISHPMPQHDIEHGASEPVEDLQDRSSPVVPGVQRPPTAMHPYHFGGRRSSYYSEASHIDRFGDKMI
jgi:hypothetical protein